MKAGIREAWTLFIEGLEAKKKDADEAKDTVLANLFQGKIKDATKAAKAIETAKEGDSAVQVRARNKRTLFSSNSFVFFIILI